MSKITELAKILAQYNDAYRSGTPLVSDAKYDELTSQLRELAPDHPFLNRVEPEAFTGKREVRHPSPMLSTEKAYTPEELERFVTRVAKEAAEIGVTEVRYRVTPKLDGLAGRDDGLVFATRGNGSVGYEVSSAFAKGMIPLGGRGKGVGEMVILSSYFQEHLVGLFEHPRNLVVGIVSADSVNEHARKALAAGVVHFVPYGELPAWEGAGDALVANMSEITRELGSKADYPLDGMVVEVLDEDVRRTMGATSHHYRWQIAVKSKGETATTTVQEVVWQVGRTGKVTPVLLIEPVNISGATIRRVTGHNAGFLQKKGLGPGAEVEIIRSGEVIPKIEDVLVAAHVDLPEVCPSCGTSLVRENDFLVCGSSTCSDQTVQTIEHWFKTLGNADWFGEKSIQKIVTAGHTTLNAVYAITAEDFVGMGFGPGQAANLAEALKQSRDKEIEDWRFLAAFGVEDLGRGDSRRLLEEFTLEDLFSATEQQISSVKGFGALTAASIVTGLEKVADSFSGLMGLGFSLKRTGKAMPVVASGSSLAGKHIVFTGKMELGSRDAMEQQARELGALVQSSVNSKTDFLVCGANVGASKTNKAKACGTAVVSEMEYLKMVG